MIKLRSFVELVSGNFGMLARCIIFFGPSCGAPLLWGALFGRTCWTCLNPPLQKKLRQNLSPRLAQVCCCTTLRNLTDFNNAIWTLKFRKVVQQQTWARRGDRFYLSFFSMFTSKNARVKALLKSVKFRPTEFIYWPALGEYFKCRALYWWNLFASWATRTGEYNL